MFHFAQSAVAPRSSAGSISRMRGAAGLHPLLTAAAISVIVLAVVGVGVLTGLLPSPLAKSIDHAELAASGDSSAARAADLPQPSGRDFGRKAVPGETAVSREAPQRARAATPASRPAKRLAAASCNQCGTVQSVRAVQRAGSGTGLGAVGGGVVGGVVGNQFGGGSGRAALTVLGAVGGAFAGNEVEKRVRTTTSYEMTVRMEDGSLRTFHSDSPYNWRSGDPVRVVDGTVVSRGAGSGASALRVGG